MPQSGPQIGAYFGRAEAGRDIVVNIGVAGAELQLTRLDLRKEIDAPRSELDLLITDLRATKFTGRDLDLKSLQDWFAETSKISARCIVGPAGSGKTRLAIELCARAEGWQAGFVRESELRRFQTGPGFAAWRWPEPTLIVVDNAASVAAILRDWFETLAARVMDPDGPPLRILLLERNADEGGQEGWWGELMRPG